MKYFLLTSTIGFVLFFSSCKKESAAIPENRTSNKVMMLKVNFLTNTFEGGKELTYSDTTQTFSINSEYKAPADFGSIKLSYQELNQTLFDGTIVWMGKGQINYPQNLAAAGDFNSVMTADVVQPGAGFQNIFNPQNQTYNYAPVWIAVQRLVKVREYLHANPNATVKLFLYTPSVGAGNPADADWIIFLKN